MEYIVFIVKFIFYPLIWVYRKICDMFAKHYKEKFDKEHQDKQLEISKICAEAEKLKSKAAVIAAKANIEQFNKNLALQTLIENRKKPTWCHACDVNRAFLDWVPVPGDENYIVKRYICPSCKSTDYCKGKNA